MVAGYVMTRISQETLLKCKNDVSAVENIINFNNLPDSEKLDLGPWPTIFEKLKCYTFQKPEILLCLHLIQYGQCLLSSHIQRHIHPGYVINDINGYFIDGDISLIEMDMVKFIVNHITTLDREYFFSPIPKEKELAEEFLGIKCDEHPRYLLEIKLDIIMIFYKECLERHLFPVIWYD